MEPLSFTYSGHSANWDTYNCSDESWYAEVLWMDFRTVLQPDGSRRQERLKPAEYTVTVRHLGPSRWEEVGKFKYRPSRNPKDMHLPNRTVTRLIRHHLSEQGQPDG